MNRPGDLDSDMDNELAEFLGTLKSAAHSGPGVEPNAILQEYLSSSLINEVETNVKSLRQIEDFNDQEASVRMSELVDDTELAEDSNSGREVNVASDLSPRDDSRRRSSRLRFAGAAATIVVALGFAVTLSSDENAGNNQATELLETDGSRSDTAVDPTTNETPQVRENNPNPNDLTRYEDDDRTYLTSPKRPADTSDADYEEFLDCYNDYMESKGYQSNWGFYVDNPSSASKLKADGQTAERICLQSNIGNNAEASTIDQQASKAGPSASNQRAADSDIQSNKQSAAKPNESTDNKQQTAESDTPVNGEQTASPASPTDDQQATNSDAGQNDSKASANADATTDDQANSSGEPVVLAQVARPQNSSLAEYTWFLDCYNNSMESKGYKSNWGFYVDDPSDAAQLRADGNAAEQSCLGALAKEQSQTAPIDEPQPAPNPSDENLGERYVLSLPPQSPGDTDAEYEQFMSCYKAYLSNKGYQYDWGFYVEDSSAANQMSADGYAAEQSCR